MSSPRFDKSFEGEPEPEGSPGDTGGPTEPPSFLSRWWSRVEPWRRLMLGGGIILLAISILGVVMGESLPDLASLVAYSGGYLLLALGFAQFFRDRRKK
jgi:hypothetical protein